MGEVHSTAHLERCARCSARLEYSLRGAVRVRACRVRRGASAPRGGFAQRQRSRRRAQKRRQTGEEGWEIEGTDRETDTGGELMLGILHS